LKLVNIDENDWVFADSRYSKDIERRFDEGIDTLDQGLYDISETILKSVIEIAPFHIDALHHLSIVYESTKNDLEAYLACREAYRIGLSCFPDNFQWDKSRLDWGNLSNRPFIRAMHNLGLWLHRRGEYDNSIEVFSKLNQLCPNDNLGARYELMELYFEVNDYESILSLCSDYPDDYSPDFLYGKPLAHLKQGDFDTAKLTIRDAQKAFPLVTNELLRDPAARVRPKSDIPGFVSHGSHEQAFSYWERFGEFWESDQGALDLLRKPR